MVADSLRSPEAVDYSLATWLAPGLHGNFYHRKRFLHADNIEASLDELATLLNLLEPLTAR